MLKKLSSYAITFVVAAGIVLTVLGINGVFAGGMEQTEIIRHICDAFFIAGMLLLCISGLMWSSDMGTFDGLKYMVTSLFRLRFSTRRYDWKEKESFADYKERIHAPEKKRNIKYLPVIGALYFAVSLILLIVFYCI